MAQLTVKLTKRLHDRLLAEAAKSNRDLDSAVAEALKEWLETQEDIALSPIVEEARRDIREHGATPADEFFRQVRSESARKRAV